MFKISNAKLLFLINCLLLVYICEAAIISTDSIKEIENELQKLDKNILIIFDVDDVIISPKDQLLKSHNKTYLEKCFSTTVASSSLIDADKIWSIAWRDHIAELIDYRIPKIITKFQYRGNRIIALTKADTGTYGFIESIEAHRFNVLKQLKIDFSITNKDLHNDIFVEEQCKYTKLYPSYYQGILFSCGLPKSKVLDMFLKKYQLNIDSVALIDDKYVNLEDVNNYCKEHNISFHGYHYTLVANTIHTPLNQEKINFQINTLHKKKIWYSDEQIKKLWSVNR